MKRYLLPSFIILTVLLIGDFALYLYSRISLHGNLSDRILFGIWLLSFFLLMIANWKKLWSKILAGLSAAVVVLSIIPMGIFFFGFVLWFFGGGVDINKNLNDRYRVQVYNYGVMAKPRMDVSENFGIFEKDLPLKIDRVDSLDVLKRLKGVSLSREDRDSIYLKITDENNNLHTAGFPKNKK